jgi:hypothetical protein
MRLAILASSLAFALPAHADDAAPEPPPAPPAPPRRTPFDQGRFGLSLGGGTQTALGEHYYVIGAGVSYYVLDGVGVSLSGLAELGADPFIGKLTPELRYVAQPLVGVWPVIPYIGGFYNHWFITGAYDDVDTIGGRAGLLYLSGSLILGLGVAYEHTVSACTTTPTMDCDQVYPDFTISFAL